MVHHQLCQKCPTYSSFQYQWHQHIYHHMNHLGRKVHSKRHVDRQHSIVDQHHSEHKYHVKKHIDSPNMDHTYLLRFSQQRHHQLSQIPLVIILQSVLYGHQFVDEYHYSRCQHTQGYESVDCDKHYSHSRNHQLILAILGALILVQSVRFHQY